MRADPTRCPPVLPQGSPLTAIQVLPTCLGVVLFALSATGASVSSLGQLTPPPELSIATSPIGHSVASVQLGSAGPIPAELEIRNGGRTLWRSRLARTTKARRLSSIPPAQPRFTRGAGLWWAHPAPGRRLGMPPGGLASARPDRGKEDRLGCHGAAFSRVDRHVRITSNSSKWTANSAKESTRPAGEGGAPTSRQASFPADLARPARGGRMTGTRRRIAGAPSEQFPVNLRQNFAGIRQ